MKKITLLLAVMIMSLMASSQVLLDETFETGFPFGAANTTTGPTNGWTTTNLAFVGTISRTVSAASVLTYPATGTKWINSGVGNGFYNNYGSTGSSQALSWKSFTASPVTSGNVFLSFLYKCTAKGGSNSPVMSISDINSAGNGAIVWCAGDATNVRLGVTRSSTTAADVQYAGTAGGAGSLVINTVYLIVLKYNIDNSTAYLYINPTVGGAEPAYQAYDDGNFGTKVAARPASFQYLKIYNTGSSKSYFIASGARVSQSWSDAVAPYVSALPKITAPSPIVDAASVGPTYFTAGWTSVAAASNYTVNVYSSDGSSLLKSQTTTGGTSTTSLVVTGLTPNTTYTYKVYAIATDQVNNANSLETSLSNTFTTPGYTQLGIPTLRTASNILAESITARWTAVTGAGGYVVKLYDSNPTLVKTLTVTGQSTDSLNINGLTLNSSYTYTVTAKGDLITYTDSSESGYSGSFTTSANYPTNINTNFSDGTWGTLYSSSNAPGLGTYPVISANGFDLTHAYVQSGTNTGPKGEAHSCTLRLDKTSNSGVLYSPVVASVAQIEIHSSATAGRQLVVEVSSNGGAYSTAGTVTASGSEQIDIIPVSATNAKFRFTDISTGQYVIYQITTRNTNPSLLTAPAVGTVSNKTATTCTANWTPVDVNGTNYEVKVYKGTTLKVTATTIGGQATSSIAITGLQADSTYTYKVKAIGDGDVSYSDSYQSAASASFTMGHQLATPVVGSASVSTTGITANWSYGTTINVVSYDVKVYQGSTLIKTVNVADPNATSVNINGLEYATAYTFTVTAIGDNSTYYNSFESAKSSVVTTDLGTGLNHNESAIKLYVNNKEIICSQTGDITIYNVQGEKVREANTVNKLSPNLNTGLYIVRFTSQSAKVVTLKLIVKD